jgi:tyrosine-protein kinase Etk/Wzc
MKDLNKYLKRWYWFAISIGVFVLLGFMFLLYIDPQYQITAAVLIQEDKKGETTLNETAFSDLNMFHTNKTADNETQKLLSIDLLTKVFKDLSLDTRYYINKTFKRKEVYLKSAPIKVNIVELTPLAYRDFTDIRLISNNTFELTSPIDGSKHNYSFGQQITNPYYTITITKTALYSTDNPHLSISFTDVVALAKSYNSLRLQITPVVKDANTLLLSVNDNIPQRGVDILNRLIYTYNKQSADHKTQLANETISFIDSRLKYLNNDLMNVESNVQQYKQNNSVTNIQSDAQDNLQKSGEYNQQLQAIQIQLNIVQSTENYLNESADQITLVPSTLGLQDETLVSLINRFNEQQQTYQQLLSTNQPNNPLVQNAKKQLTSLKESIQENLKSTKRSMLITRSNLEANLAKYEAKIRTVPVIETGIQQRDRDQLVKQNLFQYLLQKREETSLSLLATQPDASIIDSPNYDPNATKPKPMLIYLCAIIFGGLVPVVLLFVKEIINVKVEHVDDLSSFNEIKILGELCHINKKESIRITNDAHSSVTELFRYIRNTINGNYTNYSNQVLLVTSCIQNEGKTFTAINLGLSLSSISKKTIILEFDLRKPDLLKSLKIKPSIGISDYLNSDDVSVDSIIQASNISPDLFVIGAGTICNNPGELILDPKIGDLFIALRKRFDYIIIDTSPIGMVADALTLSPYTDSSIFVVRYNHTQKSHLKILKDIVENKKLKNPMLILNDAKVENLKSYVYGSNVYA